MARSQARFQNFSPGARSLRPVNDALNARGSSLGFADASTNVSRARLVGSCRTDACQSDPTRVPWTKRACPPTKVPIPAKPNRLSVAIQRTKFATDRFRRWSAQRAATFLAEKAAPSLRSALGSFPFVPINISPRGSNYVPVPYVSPEPGNRPTTLAGPSL